MKIMSALTVALLIAFSGNALAHSPVKETSPENKAVLSVEPEMLHLTFAAPARVMKVTMTHKNGDALHEKTIKIPTRDMVEEIHLTPDFMGAGSYTINWRALGDDGHILKGAFSFEVTGE